MPGPLIGLMPFYLELYDRTSPGKRKECEKFLRSVSAEISKSGVDVIVSPVCRVKEEFRRAAALFKRKGADAIVTLHLAYSPSLESSDVLAESGMPVIVFDTTPEPRFGPGQSPAKIMFNHGIHGVQDMCNLMVRNRVNFTITAGHIKDPGTLERLRDNILGAKCASVFKKTRTGIIGKPFRGMGDFQVSSGELRETGITTVKARKEELKKLSRDVNAAEIRREIKNNEKMFAVNRISSGLYENTVRSCLALRKWVGKERLDSFTMNFMEFDGSFLPSVPFLEAGKLMARGIGYAGEGDILTAALAGAILSVNEDSTFTEMFCPDWKDGMIFLSHMGEANVKTFQGRAALIEKAFPYAGAENPVTAAGRLKSGEACIVNLAPAGKGKFRLIICPGKIPSLKSKDRMNNTVRGWFKPDSSLEEFLEKYSISGGTHHSVLAYGLAGDVIRAFGVFMGWETVRC